MAKSRTTLAVGLAAATLLVFVVVIAMGGASRAGLAPWPGIGVAVLAIAAFAVSRERRSFVVAGLLAVSGVVGVVYALLQNGVPNGHFVSWSDLRDHPRDCDTRTGCSRGRWSHSGPKTR